MARMALPSGSGRGTATSRCAPRFTQALTGFVAIKVIPLDQNAKTATRGLQRGQTYIAQLREAVPTLHKPKHVHGRPDQSR